MNFIRHALLATWLAACLAACGPGTGGTGGGTGGGSGLVTFGATAASVCAAPIASQLRCEPEFVTSPAPPPNAAGTRLQSFADSASGATLTVEFDGNRADLEARCAGLRFEGDWGVTPNGQTRYYGTATRTAAGAPPPVPATLEVTIPADAPAGSLLLILRDAGGTVLLGPVIVQKGDGGTAGSC